ncbi:RrF2 family transcriptional regulator [Vagococcus xieshaowenii]|uniref:Rrf2 family transcriptional regulator n=1 Tax=Vagococcus xieshaowenii TaxID=2562451 RepID=A0AAJ5EF29_9ENTE|nr:Rrf2 family transcriptional regulator [Vagococcus xieshaowenii]QCA29102.1 Rrf2 family transcriptional regulator [Vagococcus xieshaowenii]TFZ40922.1 Rrf2 family transcriptional regulator [Vagococcus xieshaowenii]
MKLTFATEQAIAVVALMATQEPEIALSSESIYQKLNLSKSYVQKLLRKLVVANIISGATGNNGGFKLDKSLESITLYDVVSAIEGEFISLSNSGILEEAFANFGVQAKEGHQVIAKYFNEADVVWINHLKSVNVKLIMEEVFGVKKNVVFHDWNNE